MEPEIGDLVMLTNCSPMEYEGMYVVTIPGHINPKWFYVRKLEGVDREIPAFGEWEMTVVLKRFDVLMGEYET